MSGILGRTLTLYIRDSSAVYRLVGQVQTKNFSHERSLVNISDEIGQTHALNLNSGLRSISIGLSGVVPTTAAANIIGYNLLKTAAMGVSDDPLTFKLTSDDIRIDGTGFISSFSETGQVSGAILYSASLMLDTSPTIDLAPVGLLDLGSCVVTPFAIAGGTANALTATFTDLTLVDGAEVKLRAAFANTATAPTLSSNAGTPVVITRLGNQALRAGDIDSAGHEMTLRYVIASPVRWELLNPANADLFWSAPIGTIIEAPTAPSDGGTWLECTGQAVSQSTYSTLYSLLGHSWAQFKIDGVNLNSTITASSGRVFWTTPTAGTGVYFMHTDSGSTYISADCITWTPKTSVGGAITGYSFTSDSDAVWFVWQQAGSTSAINKRSVDQGVTWTTPAAGFPFAFTQIHTNGTHWVGFMEATQNVASSSDSGNTWTNHGAVLPAPLTNGKILWDGTNWLVFEEITGTTSSRTWVVYKTSVSNGSSGWTTVALPAEKYGAVAAYRRDTGEIVTVSGHMCQKTSGQLSFSAKQISMNTPHPESVIWNGFVYVGFAEISAWDTYNTARPTNGGVVLVSKEGLVWNPVTFPLLHGNVNSTIFVASHRFAKSSNSCANPVTGDIAVVLHNRTDAFTSPSSRHTALLKFNFTAGTQFCVPELPGTIPKWIKAL